MQNKNFSRPGYEYLSAYQLGKVIQDLTVEFCNRFIDKASRTHDQMVQAGRSDPQNVAEGYMAESLKSYIFLVGVAHGSNEELAKDYQDYLRQNNLEIWEKDNPKVRVFREFRVHWISQNTLNTPILPNDPQEAANFLLTLCQMEGFLLKKLVESLKKKHIEEGGFTENLYQKRIAYRNTHPNPPKLPNATLIFLFTILTFLASASSANADYYAQGVLESSNILSGATVTTINSFEVEAVVPAGTTVNVKFSQDRVNYYNSSGLEDGWDSCANGTTNIDLSSRGLIGEVLFYKLQLTTTDINATPVVLEVQVNYDGTAVPPISGITYYNQGILESTNILSGATVTAINSFLVSATLPPGTTASVKFSQDKVNYYNSAGVKDGWDSCANGTTNINLSGLSWSGGSLFYKIKLETWVDNAFAPKVNEVSISYDGTVALPPSGNTFYSPGILVSTDLLSGSGIKFNKGNNKFGWHITSLPFGTSVEVQFSQNGTAWYNSAGTLEGWDTLSLGKHMNDDDCLNLSSLGWEGAASFYYKLRLSTTIDEAYTPVVSEAGLFKLTKINSPDMPVGSKIKINTSQTDKLTDGLVGMWSFDGPDVSGTTAYDRSPISTNHGTISGATPVIGKKGQGLTFDGVGDYVVTNGFPSLGREGTISAWIKSNGETGTAQIITGIYNNTLRFAYQYNLDRVGFIWSDASRENFLVDSVGANDGNWHFVTVTADSSDIKIYVDGQLKGSKGSGTISNSESGNLSIGARNSGESYFFYGGIDEVRVYDCVLLGDEILDLYNLGKIKIIK